MRNEIETITEATRRVAAGLNRFGLDLQQRFPAEANTCISALSIGAALAAVRIGARGETAQQMAHTLHLPDDPAALAEGMRGLHAALGPRDATNEEWDPETGGAKTTASESFRLSLSTALWVLEAYRLHADFCDELAAVYASEFFSDRFEDPHASAARINAWVAERTEGRIPALLSPDLIDRDTRLILTNAVYFKAQWATPFETFATEPRPFFLESGEEVEIPRMMQDGMFATWHDEEIGVHTVTLPYEQGVSMVVVLPDPGRMGVVASRLEHVLAAAGHSSTKRLLEVHLPKWEVRFQSELRSELMALGMEIPFDARADFGGMTPEKGGLAISQVVHEAWMKVDEEGTEAAAATAVVMTLGLSADLDPPIPEPFVVDRPFYYFIQDDQTGAVLFQGHLMDPRS